MKRSIIIKLIASFVFQINIAFGQVPELITESETHIYWQPNRKLTLTDFKGTPPLSEIKYCEEKGACVVPCHGLFVKVDIPKNYRKNKLEKVYYAPAFEKACSYIMGDTKDVRDAQIQFDMLELSSRIARKLLRDYHDYMASTSDSNNFQIIKQNPDTILITGVGTSLAWHARDSAWTFYQDISTSYIRSMYFNEKKKTYEEWRKLVDELLEKYKMYATRPDECYRIIKKQPIIKKHKEAYK
jgi:hypothetical protein